MDVLNQRDLNTGKCPKCGATGMKYPPHPHAFGHWDFDRVRCRKHKKCGATFDAAKYEAWLKKKDAPTP